MKIFPYYLKLYNIIIVERKKDILYSLPELKIDILIQLLKYFSGKGIVSKEEFSADRRHGKQPDTGIFYNSLFNK